MMDYERMKVMDEASGQLREAAEWDRWVREIPFIQWPTDWRVKAVPPFSGAIVRYLIEQVGIPGWVSVYLDCYSMLGVYEDFQPYWEVYPGMERCAMHETDELLGFVEDALEKLRSREEE